MKRKHILLFIVLLTVIAAVVFLFANIFLHLFEKPDLSGWVTEDGRRYYLDEYGEKVTDQQRIIDMKNYSFAPDGTVFKGEKYIDGYVYYFGGSDGAQMSGWIISGNKRCYYDIFGRKIFGKQKTIDGKLYLFKATGAVYNGQILIDSEYYYFDAYDGKLFNAERSVDGKWFFYGEEGKRFGTGWHTFPDGRIVYFNGEDGMLFGEQIIDGNMYLLNISSGGMMTGTVYFFGFKYTIGEDGIVAAKEEMQILKGIDVSYHQGNINWKTVASAGIQFAMIRAGYVGSENSPIFVPDSSYVKNVLEAQANGISVGSYVFVYSYNDKYLTAGLDEFHQFTVDNRINFDLPVFLDVEDSKFFKPNTDTLGGYDYRTELIRGGMDQLKDLGYKAGLYSFLRWANKEFDTYGMIEDGYYFWLASWYKNNEELDPATMAWNDEYPDIWQYRDTGRIPGIRGAVDMDYMYLDIMRTKEPQ